MAAGFCSSSRCSPAGAALTTGVDMSESVSDADACRRWTERHTAWQRREDARVITDGEVMVGFAASLQHGLNLLERQRRGPRNWTDEEEATFRTRTYDDCLWQRRGRAVPR
jgi:hypothetical protein